MYYYSYQLKLNVEEMSKRGMKYVLGCDLGENSLRLHIYKCDDPQSCFTSQTSNREIGNW